MVHLAHDLVLYRVKICKDCTYAVCLNVLIILKLDSSVLSSLIVMEHLLLLVILILHIRVPVVHLLVLVESLFNVFLSLLNFLLLIIV